MKNFSSQQIWIGVAILGSLLSLVLYLMSSGSSNFTAGLNTSNNRSNACIEMLDTLRDGERAYAKNPTSDLKSAMKTLRSTYLDICN